MTLELANYKDQAKESVKLFWGNREAALPKQAESGKQDTGARGAVTTGKNLDGFLTLFQSLVEANGLRDAEICVKIIEAVECAQSVAVGHYRDHITRLSPGGCRLLLQQRLR